MAVTYSPTPLGTFQSLLSAALFCVASGAQEAVTLVHGLPTVPTKAPVVMLRSFAGNNSGAPVFTWHSVNGSQCVGTFQAMPNTGALSVTADVVCEFTYRKVQ